MLTRYFIKLSFKGSNYHGWQVQPNAETIQGTINQALSLILKEDVSTIGAGRTDSGVHALNFMAHFDSCHVDLDSRKDLKYKLNSLLPQDIFLQEIYKVNDNDHARYSALNRTYHYIVSCVKNPFLKDFSYYIYWNISLNSMNDACRLIEKQDDFTSFSKADGNTKSYICNVISAEWREPLRGILVLRIRADRFLRGMVRALAGTMLDIGRNKISPGKISEILESKDRSMSSMAVPARGLFLTQIKYSNDLIPDDVNESSNMFTPFQNLFF